MLRLMFIHLLMVSDPWEGLNDSCDKQWDKFKGIFRYQKTQGLRVFVWKSVQTIKLSELQRYLFMWLLYYIISEFWLEAMVPKVRRFLLNSFPRLCPGNIHVGIVLNHPSIIIEYISKGHLIPYSALILFYNWVQILNTLAIKGNIHNKFSLFQSPWLYFSINKVGSCPKSRSALDNLLRMPPALLKGSCFSFRRKLEFFFW